MGCHGVRTWVEEKDWNKIRRKLPEGYKWEMQGATRKGKSDRWDVSGYKKEFDRKREGN